MSLTPCLIRQEEGREAHLQKVPAPARLAESEEPGRRSLHLVLLLLRLILRLDLHLDVLALRRIVIVVERDLVRVLHRLDRRRAVRVRVGAAAARAALLLALRALGALHAVHRRRGRIAVAVVLVVLEHDLVRVERRAARLALLERLGDPSRLTLAAPLLRLALDELRRPAVVVEERGELDVQVGREPVARLERGEEGVQRRGPERVGGDLCGYITSQLLLRRRARNGR